MAGQRPNAAILGYPVIDKDTVEAYLPGAPDAAKAVDEHTCPCFVFAGRDDTTVPVANTLAWLEALTRYDISYECHIYSQAGHGFSALSQSLGAQGLCSRAPHWVSDSTAWLRDVFGDFFRRRPRCAALPGPGQRQPGKRLQRGLHARLPAAKPGLRRSSSRFLQPLLARLHLDALPASLSGLLFRQLAGMIALPPEQLAAIDTALHAVPKQQTGGIHHAETGPPVCQRQVVLQRDQAVPVWGLADPGAAVP